MPLAPVQFMMSENFQFFSFFRRLWAGWKLRLVPFSAGALRYSLDKLR